MYSEYDLCKIEELAKEYKSVRRSYIDKKAEVDNHRYLSIISLVLIIIGFVVCPLIAVFIHKEWFISTGVLPVIAGIIIYLSTGHEELRELKNKKRSLEERIAEHSVNAFTKGGLWE